MEILKEVPLSRPYQTAGHVLSLLFSGAGVGFLLSNALGPNTESLITGVSGLLVTAATVLSNLSQGRETTSGATKFIPKISPAPILFLVAGLVGGSLVGKSALKSQLLVPKKKEIAEAWAGTSVSLQEIEQRVFDTQYPPPAFPSGVQTPIVSSSEAAILLAAEDNNLLDLMLKSENPRVAKMAKAFDATLDAKKRKKDDPYPKRDAVVQTLKIVRDTLICPRG